MLDPSKKSKNSQKSSWPRITIITPSYNQGEFIEETIQSVLNQDYPNLEYFIVDGGSTDNTLDIIKSYEPRIDWWVSEPDRGQSQAINKGLARATGEIINWINSDDLLFPGALRQIARAYLRYSGEMHLISGASARISEEGKILRISSPPSAWAFSPKCCVIPIGQQSSFFTRKAIELTGYLREDLQAIMDLDLYVRILLSGGELVRVRGLIGAIRNHEKAKGFAKPELFEQEYSAYIESLGGTRFRTFLARLKMKIIRIIDTSYLRSYYLTKSYSDKSLKGTGLIDAA